MNHKAMPAFYILPGTPYTGQVMSGHNKWTQIKHQKGAADKKRGLVFSKILKAITSAARDEINPEFNPRLRALIEKARAAAVPNDTIERAIKKTENAKNLEELTLEAYGPAGIAFLIAVITDNRNRAINEIKHILSEHEGKLAEQGGVRWAFVGDRAKFPQSVSVGDAEKIQKLTNQLEKHDDVQNVITNAAPNPAS